MLGKSLKDNLYHHVQSVPPYMVIRHGIEQVRFQCYVDGLPARKGETKWMRDSQVVECDYNHRVFACDNIIIITHFRMRDSGEYTCRMTENNSTGNFIVAKIFGNNTKFYSVHKIINRYFILVPASFDDPKVEVMSVRLGGSVDLHSPVSNHSYPQPVHIFWRKGRQYIAEGATLHLTNMTKNTTGMYESVIFNGYGEPAVKSYDVGLDVSTFTGNFDLPVFIALPPKVTDVVEFESMDRSDCNQSGCAFLYIYVTVAVLLFFRFCDWSIDSSLL